MDFDYSPQEEAFRKELRDWLAENMKELPDWWGNPDAAGPRTDSDEYHQFSLWWHRKLYDAGYVGLAWPKEYGGRDATIMQQVVFSEEMAKHGAPGPANGLGIGWCGPTIMAAGTEEQKRRFLPKILSAEEIWCQGFSEPEAGSDLASVQTRAVEDGDNYIINGQKVWTSEAHYADWAVLLARTDPDVPKHRGLSYFLLDMHSPGVTTRPLVNITGYTGFNEVFLEDVRIPKNLMVGEKNRGWYIAMSTLEFERSALGESVGRESQVRALIKMARQTERNGQPLAKDRVIRQKLAQLYIETNILKYIGLRNLTHQLRKESLGPEAMMGYVFGAEFSQRLADFSLQLQGSYSQLVRGSKYAVRHGRHQYSFLWVRMNTIGGGTSEIKRNIIAQRTLGLPR